MAKTKKGKARRRSKGARSRAPAAPRARRRPTRGRRTVKRRRRRRTGTGASFTRSAKTAATTAVGLGVTGLLFTGFGNRLLSGMFATPTTRALGKAALALTAGYALWKLKARKTAAVVMTAGVAASVMEVTGTVAGPQIDAVMARLPALKSLTGPPAAAPAAPIVAGVGRRLIAPPIVDPIFPGPF